MKQQSKAKQKRRRQGKHWVAEYKGRNILYAYKKKFNVPLITAVNDLDALGVNIDERVIARIKLDRHHYGKQQLTRVELDRLSKILEDGDEW